MSVNSSRHLWIWAFSYPTTKCEMNPAVALVESQALNVTDHSCSVIKSRTKDRLSHPIMCLWHENFLLAQWPYLTGIRNQLYDRGSAECEDCVKDIDCQQSLRIAILKSLTSKKSSLPHQHGESHNKTRRYPRSR